MSGYVLSSKAVSTLRQLIRGNAFSGGSSFGPASICVDRYPPPFTVRWNADEGSSGSWMIWLPDRSKLVMFADSAISTISGVTAAQHSPSGWYTIDNASSSTTAVYLVVSVVDSTGVATAAIDTSAGTATTGTTVYNVLVATLSVDQTTGAKSVKQFVDSAVTLGGSDGGGGLSGTVEFVADIDWYVNGSIHQIRKRIRVLNLATGVVTDKAGTTYQNGWEVAANTTPISSIIGS